MMTKMMMKKKKKKKKRQGPQKRESRIKVVVSFVSFYYSVVGRMPSVSVVDIRVVPVNVPLVLSNIKEEKSTVRNGIHSESQVLVRLAMKWDAQVWHARLF
jgi:hypothetical protein